MELTCCNTTLASYNLPNTLTPGYITHYIIDHILFGDTWKLATHIF